MQKQSGVILLYISLLILFSLIVPNQKYFAQKIIRLENLKSNFAKSENKEKYYTNLIKNIESTFSSKINGNYKNWSKALKDAQSINLTSRFVYNGLLKSLRLQVDKNLKLQRTSLEVAYTLYKNDFLNPIKKILDQTNDPISFSISAIYLNAANNNRDFYKTKLIEKFPNYKESELLNSLINDFSKSNHSISDAMPNINDLLNYSFQEGKTIIFSFQRKNRLYPGLTIIKKPDGEFVKNNNGELFYIKQLALSYSNLPSYIPNGNTPQGIYSVVGTYISPTETIGPTPNILVRSPYEVPPKIFFHGRNNNKNWSLVDYQNLLPKSWQKYSPIYHSYYAGKFGRKLIIMHGSTDELEYYKNMPYYPLTPTKGCLSSTEIWSGDSGKCLESDQVKLINAFRSTKQTKGFLVVVELDDQQRAITIEEIKELLKKSPQR